MISLCTRILYPQFELFSNMMIDNPKLIKSRSRFLKDSDSKHLPRLDEWVDTALPIQ